MQDSVLVITQTMWLNIFMPVNYIYLILLKMESVMLHVSNTIFKTDQIFRGMERRGRAVDDSKILLRRNPNTRQTLDQGLLSHSADTVRHHP